MPHPVVLILLLMPVAGPERVAAPVARVYAVNRLAMEFPDKEDLSSPEATWALTCRLLARGERGAWGRVSSRRIADRLASSGEDKAAEPDVAAMWLNSKAIEVRMYRDVYAGVIAKRLDTSGTVRIDLRRLAREEGQWLNAGHDIAATLDEARQMFAAGCAEYAPPATRPAIADPDEYLRSVTDFVLRNGEEPRECILKALANRRLVILGEVHHRPRYWAFNAAIVTDPRFAKRAGTIYMELPLNGQKLVDGFLASDTLNAAPVIEMLRDMLWMGWPDQGMLDFFVAVWKVNRQQTPESRLRIVLVDMPRPWSLMRTKADVAGYECDRDRLMADNILADLHRPEAARRAGLFIVGAMHATLNLKYADETTPITSAGWRLREALGRDRVYGVFPHAPRETNKGRVHGRLAHGLFDSVFEATSRKPVAIRLDEGPFAEQPFDAFPDRPAYGMYRDAFDAYLYLGPLEDERFADLIQDFYTDEFVRELDRRHQLLFGQSLVSAYRLRTLDAKSFTAWMMKDCGQPRRSWLEGLGERTAWKREQTNPSSKAVGPAPGRAVGSTPFR